MGCDLNFYINGVGSLGDDETLTFENTTLQKSSSLQEIAQYIINNEDIAKTLKDELKNATFKSGILYSTSLNPVANYTVKQLQSKYPYMNWNEDQLSDKILAVNSYTLKNNYGSLISGPRVLSDGTIIVNINKEEDVRIVNAYLKRKYLLENKDDKINMILDRYKFVEELFKSYQKKLKKSELKDINPKIEDILLNFIQNSEEYKSIYSEDGTSLYTILKWAINEMDDIPVKSYGDTLTDEINNIINFDQDKAYIYKDDLQRLLEIHYGKSNFLSDKDISNEVKLQTLIDNYFKNLTIDFPYEPYLIKKNKIFLKLQPKSFGSKYPDFIKEFNNIKEVKSFRGYHIYEWNTENGIKYIYSKGILTEASYSTRMYSDIRSIEKILQDKKYEAMDNFYEFHMPNNGILYSPHRYTPGTILEVLDSSSLNLQQIDIDSSVSDLFYNLDISYKKIEKYLSDVYNIPEGTFDTSEKMLLFLHSKLQYNSSNQELIDKINNLPKKYYYVEDSTLYNSKYSGNYYRWVDSRKLIAQQYQSRLFELDMDEDIDGYKPKYDGKELLATRNILINLSNLLKDKFGVNIEVLTQDEINDKFSDEAFDSSAKAFIRNGIIYINSSKATSEDVFHEYAHIFLGVLKATNYDLYEKLMESMDDQRKKQEIKELYPDLANQDVNEEVFAFYLGKYLANNRVPRNLQQNLDKAKDSVLKGVQSIFNKNISGDALFSGNIWKTMNEFTSNMLLLVEENKSMLINPDIQGFRKASNWIGKQLKEGNIIEDCV